MAEKDAIYANPRRARTTTCTPPNSRPISPNTTATPPNPVAGELLIGVGIPSTEQHNGPMREVAPAGSCGSLLCQALFANPDILLLDEPTNNLDINTIRWLEEVLNAREVDHGHHLHDRHFLNQVFSTWPTWITARSPSTRQLRRLHGSLDAGRERQSAANAKAKERIAEADLRPPLLANASKAKQATSRPQAHRQAQTEGRQAVVRQYPWDPLRIRRKDKLHRQAVEVGNLALRLPGSAAQDFNNLTFTINAGEKSPSSARTASARRPARLLMGEVQPQFGSIKRAEKARPGYYAQDHSALFQSGHQPHRLDRRRRPRFGRGKAATWKRSSAAPWGACFSGDEVKKPVKVISGGEQGRMLFGKLMLQKGNVPIMDEPTNHLDMESIEALNTGLENSPAPWFSSPTTGSSSRRSPPASSRSRDDGRVIDYLGGYGDYLASQGVN